MVLKPVTEEKEFGLMLRTNHKLGGLDEDSGKRLRCPYSVKTCGSALLLSGRAYDKKGVSFPSCPDGRRGKCAQENPVGPLRKEVTSKAAIKILCL